MRKSSNFFLSGFIAITFFFGVGTFRLFAANKYNIIPIPQELIVQQGTFSFNKQTVVLCSFQQPENLKIANQFSDQFALVSGIKLEVRDFSSVADTLNSIIFQTSADAILSAEAYRLRINPKTIRIEAQKANGFFYALQTLYQLLPVEIYGSKKSGIQKWSAPAVQIYDAPRFAYRGLHLDVCRHFFPVEFIKKYINAMAIHKLNIFHWHLTDDQGWRIEIKKYPRLTEIGSKRDKTLTGYYYENFPQEFEEKPYGGFYTQDEAKEIVAYAKERFITVIPEIELPGHAQAAIAAYPYLSCNQDSTVKVESRWGIFPEVYCPRESTFTFLEDVLTEIMAIFPSNYIHIGGDECPKDRWKTCPDCQATIKTLNLKDENGLQSYFVARIEKFVNAKGRQIIGWDEILDGGLAPNATVMSWRGIKGGITAAKSGHDVIMTPVTHCYLDYYQSDPETEPTTIGGYTTLSKVYQFEPIPAELTDEEAKHVLGAQANMWTEYMPTTERIEYMAFPRLSAMSEVLWGSKKNRNWESFRRRMPVQFKRYEQLNINASKSFFDVQFQSNITADKQLQVSLSCDNPDAQIRFTTNGKIPTMRDKLYVNPLIITKSATITAAAYVNEKPTGKALAKTYQVSLLTGLSYSNTPKNSWYDGGNINAITDGILGNSKVYTQWVGFGGGLDGEVVVDMHTVQSIRQFSVGLLSAPALCVQLSPEIQLYGSTDGNTYKLLDKKLIPASTTGKWEIFRPVLTFPSVDIRFLKLLIKNAGICPADRPHGGGGSLMFIDEIGAW